MATDRRHDAPYKNFTPCTNTLFGICLAGKYFSENLRKYLSAGKYSPENLRKYLSAGKYSPENLRKYLSTGKYSPENLRKYLSGDKYSPENLRKYLSGGKYFFENPRKYLPAGKYPLEKLRKYLSAGKYSLENLRKYYCICPDNYFEKYQLLLRGGSEGETRRMSCDGRLASEIQKRIAGAAADAPSPGGGPSPLPFASSVLTAGMLTCTARGSCSCRDGELMWLCAGPLIFAAANTPGSLKCIRMHIYVHTTYICTYS